MRSNELIPYKENIFAKISNFFKKLFFKKKESIDETSIVNNEYRDSFIENITIKENEEEKRLKNIQLQYDNGKIEEEDISDEDMDKLIEMYKIETEKLNADTQRRKIHIAQMLKELKNA